MNIIIADDEEFIRLGLQKILTKMDLDIQVIGSYSNGMDAWAHISKLGEGELDVLITDIKMPMMDGLKLIEHLRDKPIATIVLSGFSEFEYARKALRHGVRDYLLKPVDKSNLYDLLIKIKQERGEAQPGEANDTQQPAEAISKEKEHHVIEQMKSILEQEYGKNFEMERMAETVGMSANYLSRLFKQETGMTLTDYLIDIRIEKAKQFLTDHPNLKNYEISQLVGYSDPVYFNKLFKKMTGETPKDYKGKHR
ncbi:YesN/AraC family two-component response regulator [Paenibacillus endophyticus]|uniref:YesN/AraC family two-component response regulator n=1 Tax=Paenibacillus endophyticus TaxID=1294268 RepID=A0A7W5C4C4_9BACL|nr:helix-turn-helix domain-containing protein [Paenibacillus endophyticus]MBB3150965.1 YesN/AraC family two-component response regulator [Paenibacillus endophyticus]